MKATQIKTAINGSINIFESSYYLVSISPDIGDTYSKKMNGSKLIELSQKTNLSVVEVKQLLD